MKISQAVILAAGKGTRIYPLTLTKPKPLLKVCGKTILEHDLEQVKGLVKEVILVIGYRGEEIKKLIGDNYKGVKMKYVWQKNQQGTGDAVKKCQPLLKDKFLLLYGDDLYSKEDIQKCLRKFPCILLKKIEEAKAFGQVIVKKNLIQELKEKPKRIFSNLVNTGVYFLDKEILNLKIKKSERNEYEFTDYIKEFIKKEKLHSVLAKDWIPLPYAWSLLNANEFLLSKSKIEKSALIKKGVYIEGPVYIGKNCVIGPNCYLRKHTSIGDNCHIGQAVEIKNSIIGDSTKINHLSYIGDSIIGEKCNFGAGTITANLRHDYATVKTMVKGELVDTKRKKLGTIIGDNVKTGIGTLIYPGRKIWPNKFTRPGEIVTKDII